VGEYFERMGGWAVLIEWGGGSHDISPGERKRGRPRRCVYIALGSSTAAKTLGERSCLCAQPHPKQAH